MPTNTEREYYAAVYRDGRRDALRGRGELVRGAMADYATDAIDYRDNIPQSAIRKTKRKLSAWNKFVKANSKKKIYRYANGKLKLKKMGIAFRKKKRR